MFNDETNKKYSRENVNLLAEKLPWALLGFVVVVVIKILPCIFFDF